MTGTEYPMSIEIHYDPNGDWAALYVGGVLDQVGDAYLAEKNAFALLGVKTVRDGAFLRGQDSRESVARTVAEVDAYRAERAEREKTAEALRAHAALLLAEASELDGRR